jgi:hypothetical protein
MSLWDKCGKIQPSRHMMPRLDLRALDRIVIAHFKNRQWPKILAEIALAIC